MTLLSAPRCAAPLVKTASGLLVPAGVADRDAAGGGGGAGPAFVTFSLEDHTGIWPSNNFTRTIPADTQAGDLIIAGFHGEDYHLTFAPPGGAGYTELYDGNYNAGGLWLWWREAGADEGGTTELWQAVWDKLNLACWIILRGVDTTDPLDVAITEANASNWIPGSENPALAPAITPTTDGCFILTMYGNGTTEGTDTDDTGYPAGYTGIYNRYNYGGQGSHGGAAYQVQETAAEIAQEEWGMTGVNGDKRGITMAIKPA